MDDRWFGVLGILAVHAGIGVMWLIIRWICQPFFKRAFFGLYLVLMPLGFQVWDNPKDELMWSTLAMVIIGLLWISWRMRRAVHGGW
jgi:hypothetical protein